MNLQPSEAVKSGQTVNLSALETDELLALVSKGVKELAIRTLTDNETNTLRANKLNNVASESRQLACMQTNTFALSRLNFNLQSNIISFLIDIPKVWGARESRFDPEPYVRLITEQRHAFALFSVNKYCSNLGEGFSDSLRFMNMLKVENRTIAYAPTSPETTRYWNIVRKQVTALSFNSSNFNASALAQHTDNVVKNTRTLFSHVKEFRLPYIELTPDMCKALMPLQPRVLELGRCKIEYVAPISNSVTEGSLSGISGIEQFSETLEEVAFGWTRAFHTKVRWGSGRNMTEAEQRNVLKYSDDTFQKIPTNFPNFLVQKIASLLPNLRVFSNTKYLISSLEHQTIFKNLGAFTKLEHLILRFHIKEQKKDDRTHPFFVGKNVNGKPITPLTKENVEDFSKLPHLKSLNLFADAFEDIALDDAILKTLLSYCPHLEEISLPICTITKEALNHFSLCKNLHLLSLRVQGTRVISTSLFESVAKCTKLKYLRLSLYETTKRDESDYVSIDYSSLKQLKSLDTLEIIPLNTAFFDLPSPDISKNLLEALPNCHIFYDRQFVSEKGLYYV